MNVGNMRHRAQIQRWHPLLDSIGGTKSGNWVTLATRWCEYLPLTGRELFLAQQVQSQVSCHVSMRYFDGLTSADRLVIDGQAINILSAINPDGQKREHLIMGVERRAAPTGTGSGSGTGTGTGTGTGSGTGTGTGAGTGSATGTGA